MFALRHLNKSYLITLNSQILIRLLNLSLNLLITYNIKQYLSIESIKIKANSLLNQNVNPLINLLPHRYSLITPQSSTIYVWVIRHKNKKKPIKNQLI